MSSLRLPGLIDPHVHARDLSQAHKEDWDSCTAAALAGGITCVLAMPNTQPPVTDTDSLAGYEQAAQARARCDYGIFLGAGPGNVAEAAQLAPRAAGLKMYLDSTFGNLKMDGLDLLVEHVSRWPRSAPLAAHAEGSSLAAVILAAHLAGRSVHLCHVSRKDEIELIRRAKERGLAVTCEVCPHHLFLTQADCGLPPGYLEVRPRLATRADVDALWANLEVIDCFATDHAPHTRAEKESANPPPGFPGLETILPLLLTAADLGRLTVEDIVARMAVNPRRIFGLPEQPETWVEVETGLRREIRASEMLSRCGWTPYEGRAVTARVQRVVLRGREAYRAGQVLAAAGSGRNVRAYSD